MSLTRRAMPAGAACGAVSPSDALELTLDEGEALDARLEEGIG